MFIMNANLFTKLMQVGWVFLFYILKDKLDES